MYLKKDSFSSCGWHLADSRWTYIKTYGRSLVACHNKGWRVQVDETKCCRYRKMPPLASSVNWSHVNTSRRRSSSCTGCQWNNKCSWNSARSCTLSTMAYITELLTSVADPITANSADTTNYFQPRIRTNVGRAAWNSSPDELRQTPTFSSFKRNLKTSF